MRRVLRENVLCAFMAGVGCLLVAWLGLVEFAWNDYDSEARPAYDALVAGHLQRFLQLAPAYGGSLVERAPFALLASGLGGGELAVYRAVAVPCLLAAAVLGVWLAARMRGRGHGRLAIAVAVGICVANPIVPAALELGHPEELLGGCLCVAAVLLAGRGQALAAGLALGLAVANKEWALLAAGPVLLALAPGTRLPAASAAVLCAAAVLAPLALVSSGSFVAGAKAVAALPPTIFHPWQIWWFLGHHGQLAPGPLRPGQRVGPAWTATYSHPLILAVGLLAAALLWLRMRRTSPQPRALGEQQALLALCLLMLLRCLLDTWDISYYTLPFLLALLAWEVGREPRRAPIVALGVSVLLWLSFVWLPERSSMDFQAASFLAWSLPLAAWLGLRLLAPAERPAPDGARRPRGAQETTVRSLGRLVRTS